VQDRATGQDTPLGTGLRTRASEHNVDPPSPGVELRDHAYGHGDDPSGGLVWRDRALSADGIPPPGTSLRGRASGLGEGPPQRKELRFRTEGRGRAESVESVDGGWDVWSAPPGPSGDQMAKKGECDYVKRGWEATEDIPLRPSGDYREVAGPVKENTLDFEGPGRGSRMTGRPGYERDEFEGPGRGSRTTGRPGYDRDEFMGPGCGSRATGEPAYERYETGRPSYGEYGEIERHLSRTLRHRSPILDRGVRFQDNRQTPSSGELSPERYSSCSRIYRGSAPIRTVWPEVGDISRGPRVEVSNNGPVATDNNRWVITICYKCGQVGHIRAYCPLTGPDLCLDPASIRRRNNENSNRGGGQRDKENKNNQATNNGGNGNKSASPIEIKPVKLGADSLGYSKLPKSDYKTPSEANSTNEHWAITESPVQTKLGRKDMENCQPGGKNLSFIPTGYIPELKCHKNGQPGAESMEVSPTGCVVNSKNPRNDQLGEKFIGFSETGCSLGSKALKMSQLGGKDLMSNSPEDTPLQENCGRDQPAVENMKISPTGCKNTPLKWPKRSTG
jgi:hypothetical protein